MLPLAYTLINVHSKLVIGTLLVFSWGVTNQKKYHAVLCHDGDLSKEKSRNWDASRSDLRSKFQGQKDFKKNLIELRMSKVKLYYEEIVLSEKQNKSMRLFSALVSQHNSTSKWKKKEEKIPIPAGKKEKGLNYPKHKTWPHNISAAIIRELLSTQVGN